MIDGVTADDAGSDHAHRRLRVALTTADGMHQRADLGRDRDQRLAHLAGQVGGEQDSRGYRGDHSVMSGRLPDRADTDGSDGGGRGLAALPLGDEALGRRDVDVHGDRGTVALNDDGNGAVQLAYRGGHVLEVGHLGVTDFDHDVASANASLRCRTGAGAGADLARRYFRCNAGSFAHDRLGRRVQVGQPPNQGYDIDQHHADNDVHRRAGEEHSDTLPGLLLVHRPVTLVGRQVLDRGHSGDVAEPTQWNRFDPVLGFTAPGRPQGGAEADEVTAHLHSSGARDPHVATLVQGHRDQDGQRKKYNAGSEHHQALGPFSNHSGDLFIRLLRGSLLLFLFG